jgi:hypothetical protein
MQQCANNYWRGRLLNILTLAVVLIAARVANASLVTFTDFYDVPGSGYTLDILHQHYGFQHNFNDNGYNPLTDTLTSAKITLNFNTNDSWDWLFPEQVLMKLDNAQQQQWEVDSGNVGFNITVLSQLTDGILNVDLYWKQGDVQFNNSTLEVNANRSEALAPDPDPVPEPASVLLVVAGLFGVGLLRKIGYLGR